MPNYDLIAILGATASGKTPFAAALADVLDTESSVQILGKSTVVWISVQVKTW